MAENQNPPVTWEEIQALLQRFRTNLSGFREQIDKEVALIRERMEATVTDPSWIQVEDLELQAWVRLCKRIQDGND